MRTGAGSERAWRGHDERPVSVPVCKPQLPSADRLLPYLRDIDAARWYSNDGQLVRRFERRLSEHADAPSPGHVAAACNATAALTATLLALETAPGSLCMMPAWTFAATGQGVVRAGLVPWFVDVDEVGSLAPAAARRFAVDAPGRLGAVVAVSPFGRPLDARGWETFQHETGLPVVLDGAAAFDTVRASAVPVVVSLHATKVLGTGEGAFVTCADARRMRAVRERINFGFAGSREAVASAMNAKMSEYAAAVGLAALDEWSAARDAFRRVALDYAAALRGIPGLRLQSGYGTEWVSATTVVETPPGRLEAVEDALSESGIGSRRWWGDGLAAQRAFARYPRSALPVTAALAASTLGLPCWPDLGGDTVARIAEIVHAACARAPAGRR
ncbi:MAG TPA: DegT/DnrJ/EryC1/StrS family aminotransferase [Dongiaceae bacterium]|nr:DegT/DnrJ/EryC1/StrS family aminotransferase [Dongiaceae bacterium]